MNTPQNQLFINNNIVSSDEMCSLLSDKSHILVATCFEQLNTWSNTAPQSALQTPAHSLLDDCAHRQRTVSWSASWLGMTIL